MKKEPEQDQYNKPRDVSRASRNIDKSPVLSKNFSQEKLQKPKVVFRMQRSVSIDMGEIDDTIPKMSAEELAKSRLELE